MKEREIEWGLKEREMKIERDKWSGAEREWNED